MLKHSCISSHLYLYEYINGLIQWRLSDARYSNFIWISIAYTEQTNSLSREKPLLAEVSLLLFLHIIVFGRCFPG